MAPITLVQAVGPVAGTSLTSLPVTVASTGSGNSLILCITEASTGNNPNITGITLGGSATGWVAVDSALNASGVFSEIWWCPSIAGGQTALAITLANGTGAAVTCAYVYEVSGLAGTVDQHTYTPNSSGGTSQTVTSGATPATTSANEFWVGLAYSFNFSAAASFTPAGAWTNAAQQAQTDGAGFYAQSVAGYQIVSVTGAATYSATIANSNAWNGQVATFAGTSQSAVPAASQWPARPRQDRLRHHHGTRQQQLQPAFALAEVDASVSAGLAAATGAAIGADTQPGLAQVTASDQTGALATATAYNPGVTTTSDASASAGLASGTGTAYQAAAAIAPAGGLASGAGSALSPPAQVTALDPTGALAAGTAYSPAVSVVNAPFAPQQTVRRGWHRRSRHRQQVQAAFPRTTAPPYLTQVLGSGTTQYLADQYGQPFLVRGDSIWALVTSAGYAGGATTYQTDIDLYMSTRSAQGFNVAIVDVLCSNAEGLTVPFGNGNTWDNVSPWSGSIGTMNPAFWTRIDYAITSAARNGITVFLVLADSYAFNSGGGLNGMTTGQATTYGTALAARYASAPNLVWLFGNDYPQSQDSVYTNILTALRSGGDAHLATIENQTEGDSRFYFHDGTALTWGTANAQFNFVYTYGGCYPGIQYAYQESSPLCVLLGDGWYDGTGTSTLPAASRDFMRQLVWWSLSSASRGYIYGDQSLISWNPHTTLTTVPFANTDLNLIWNTYSSWTGWHQLVPDTGNVLVTGGRGSQLPFDYPGASHNYTGFSGGSNIGTRNYYVTASINPAGTLAVLYLVDATGTQNGGPVTIDQTQMVAGYTATWVDPASGATFSTTPGSSYSRSTANSQGGADWVLVLQAPPPGTDVTATPTAALASAAAQQPTTQVTAVDQTGALATGTVQQPAAQVAATDQTGALATAAAFSASVQVALTATAPTLPQRGRLLPNRHNLRRTQAQLAFIPPAADANVTAGAALATGTAFGGDTAPGFAQVIAIDQTGALATGAGQNPAAQVTAFPAAAPATAAGQNPAAQVAALSTPAVATGTAYQPVISYTPAVALATAGAANPVVQVTVLSVVALAAGAAYNPSVTTGGDASANAGLATATAIVQQPAAQVTVLPPTAPATGVAFSAATGRVPAAALATGTAQQPAVQVAALAGPAAAAAVAYSPVAEADSRPAAAVAAGSAQQPAAQVTAPAGLAAATGTAYNPSVTTSGNANANPAAALAIAAAQQPAAQVTAFPSAAPATGFAFSAATGRVPAAALATGTAYQPAAQFAALPSAAFATGTAPAAQASAVTGFTGTVTWTARPAPPRWHVIPASPRWRIIMTSFAPIAAISLEEVNVTWMSGLAGTSIDPTGASSGQPALTVQFAFPVSSGNAAAPAEPSVWYSASWLLGGTSIGYIAQALVGPGTGVVTLTAGLTYDCWSRVLGSPESPAKFAGSIPVY